MAHWIKSSMKCTSVSAVKMPSKQYAAVSALQPANSNVLDEKIVQPLGFDSVEAEFFVF